MPKYSFDNLILCTLHSLRQFVVLYARVPSQFWFFFQSFNKSELVFKSEQIEIKIRTFRWVKIAQDRFQVSQDCVIWNSRIDERAKNFMAYIGSIPSLHFFKKIFDEQTNFRFFKRNIILFRHICLLCNVNRLCNMYLIRRK